MPRKSGAIQEFEKVTVHIPVRTALLLCKFRNRFAKVNRSGKKKTFPALLLPQQPEFMQLQQIRTCRLVDNCVTTLMPLNFIDLPWIFESVGQKRQLAMIEATA